MDEQQLRRAIRAEIEAERREKLAQMGRALVIIGLGAVILLPLGFGLVAVRAGPEYSVLGHVRIGVFFGVFFGVPHILIGLSMLIGRKTRSRRR